MTLITCERRKILSVAELSFVGLLLSTQGLHFVCALWYRSMSATEPWVLPSLYNR